MWIRDCHWVEGGGGGSLLWGGSALLDFLEHIDIFNSATAGWYLSWSLHHISWIHNSGQYLFGKFILGKPWCHLFFQSQYSFVGTDRWKCALASPFCCRWRRLFREIVHINNFHKLLSSSFEKKRSIQGDIPPCKIVCLSKEKKILFSKLR